MSAIPFRSVYVIGTGSYLPGNPVANDELDRYIEPMNGRCQRIKDRILAENGIKTRHYALDPVGRPIASIATMARDAIKRCLENSGANLNEVTLLSTGTSGGDVVLPGLANMVQGELGAAPLETGSHHGVCAAGMVALKHAAMAVERREHARALVVASEFPSRLFRKSRFAPKGYNVDFDAHFLRWMLSDGAGACLLSDRPANDGLSLKLKWIHSRSFSGDFPLCMQVGYPEDYASTSYLDFPSLAEAEQKGAFHLRQNIRLLPHLFDVGIHEYARLVSEGHLDSARIDYFLCHYSSQKFAPLIDDLLKKAGLEIPRDRWYNNLAWRGNTGSASIFIMLDDFLRERDLCPGQQILCFVPESGRFTVVFALLEVVGPPMSPALDAPPLQPSTAGKPHMQSVLRSLAEIWHDFRSSVWRTPIVRRITVGQFTQDDYLRWMESWVPQVREGSRWMRAAIANIEQPFLGLREMIEQHATDEQSDYEILFQDYRRAGGRSSNIDALKRNPGGEAMSAYLYACARQTNPVGLLGAIYIIEGTGQRIIPALLPLMKRQIGRQDIFHFLAYHGVNDTTHLERWLAAVEYVLARSPDGAAANAIVEVARDTARLYAMQMELIA